MSDTKHTPGPWVLKRATVPVDDGIDVAIIGDGEIIAEVFARASATKWPPVEANASLISAAPEMFDLLQRVADYFADTDAPIGIEARRILGKVDGQ
jgi:hypothetical protein